jgi:Flp pilus assembly protein TadG
MSNRRRLSAFLARIGRDRAGVAAVELGLTAPVLAGLLIPMVDLGIGAYEKMRVQGAAEAAAQYALGHASAYNASNIQSAGQNATSLAGLTVTPTQACNCITGTTIGAAVSCTSTCSDGSTPGTFVSVATQATYTPLFSYPGVTTPMTLHGFAIVRTQ